MKIGFVLWGTAGIFPSGGVRVVTEHANRLAAKGHAVTLWHCFELPGSDFERQPRWKKYLLLYKQILARFARERIRGRVYALDHRVEVKYVLRIPRAQALKADALIAVNWYTAQALLDSGIAADKLFHLIQGYEPAWEKNSAAVRMVYASSVKNIVVSAWIASRLTADGYKVYARIPNAVDTGIFFKDNNVIKMSKTVGMIYCRQPVLKACDFGMAAIAAARRADPEIRAVVVGAETRPDDLPDWVEYLHRPTQAELRSFYNSLSVFVSSSDEEGFGLPGAEALACGCALVTTDSGGVRDYAVEGETALLSAPRDLDGLCSNILRMIADRRLAEAAAERGRLLINRDFSWQRASDELEKAVAGINGEK